MPAGTGISSRRHIFISCCTEAQSVLSISATGTTHREERIYFSMAGSWVSKVQKAVSRPLCLSVSIRACTAC